MRRSRNYRSKSRLLSIHKRRRRNEKLFYPLLSTIIKFFLFPFLSRLDICLPTLRRESIASRAFRPFLSTSAKHKRRKKKAPRRGRSLRRFIQFSANLFRSLVTSRPVLVRNKIYITLLILAYDDCMALVRYPIENFENAI
jgi:hypothetical protein